MCTSSRVWKGNLRREKSIIFSRFHADKTFREIGDQIGLSESQITRIYKTTIGKLRNILKDKGK